MTRLFLLSPASTSGKRAAMLFHPAARFDLARRLHVSAAPIGEVFTFLSGLYFRGKIAYVNAFARGDDVVRIITSDRGLLPVDAMVTLADLRGMAEGSVDHRHAPYSDALVRDAAALDRAHPGINAILLGSVATDKYVEVLAPVFGDRLLFPPVFAGIGDMSRGAVMLRCAREGDELDYAPIMSTPRRGAKATRKRAAKPKRAKPGVPLDIAPMEAKPVDELPTGDNWQYEPKWDGFRCIAFRNDDDVVLMSKSGKSLTRYFPEVVQALLELKPAQFVVDGELVVPEGKTLAFDQLLQRIHPAASRVQKLSAEHPAAYILFDMLGDENGSSLVAEPLAVRRVMLEQFAARLPEGLIHLSPMTDDVRVVQRWFEIVGGGLDGVIAKRTDLAYQSGERTGMQKMKHTWTADCVVGGFRYATDSKEVGSLLLGLYNDEGLLDHVGFTSGIAHAERKALTARLAKLIKNPGFTGNAPGGPSRWSTERSTEWQPLAPKLVVEVAYDHFTNGRFRHGTALLRWRPDKAPRQCTVAQLPAAKSSALELLED
jgi:ATP-dependent DNA ligase